jgi:translation initiation factor 1
MAKKGNSESRPVYCSEQGRLCPECGFAVGQCRCKELRQSMVTTNDGIVRISYETKGRKGKGVTVVRNIPGDSAALKVVTKKMKQLCGSGGAVKENAVEIQGDQRERLIPWLQQQGWTVKRVGG